MGMKVPNLVPGVFVWSPPPAAMMIAMEQLRIARLKRQESIHVILCPKLSTPEWQRQVYKAADCIFSISPGPDFWPANKHETLLVAVCFPFLNRPPWQLKGTPKMLSMGRKLSSLFEKKEMDGRSVLRKFLLDIKRLPTMSSSMVRKLLYFQ